MDPFLAIVGLMALVVVGMLIVEIVSKRESRKLSELHEMFEARFAALAERQLELENAHVRQDNTIAALHIQLDGIENDLESNKISGIAGATGVIKLNKSRAKLTLDKVRRVKVQSLVVKNASKQGGKRANKSRGRT